MAIKTMWQQGIKNFIFGYFIHLFLLIETCITIMIFTSDFSMAIYNTGLGIIAVIGAGLISISTVLLFVIVIYKRCSYKSKKHILISCCIVNFLAIAIYFFVSGYCNYDMAAPIFCVIYGVQLTFGIFLLSLLYWILEKYQKTDKLEKTGDNSKQPNTGDGSMC